MSVGVRESLVLEREQVAIRPDRRQEIGASACNGCPLIALGCPGKAEVAQACPPEAKTVAVERVSEAVLDDSFGTIMANSEGGFYAFPSTTNKPPTTVLLRNVQPQPSEKKKSAAELKKQQDLERKRREKKLGALAARPERQRHENKQGFFAMLGEIAAMFLAVPAAMPAKK